jgi:hypothetical protein
VTLCQIDGYLINADAIDYVSTRTTNPVLSHTQTQVAVVTFRSGKELQLEIDRIEFLRQLTAQLAENK